MTDNLVAAVIEHLSILIVEVEIIAETVGVGAVASLLLIEVITGLQVWQMY